jgi:hypothetical protein
MYMAGQKIQVLVGLDQDMLTWLKVESDQRRVPRAQIIRELILREMSTPKTNG